MLFSTVCGVLRAKYGLNMDFLHSYPYYPSFSILLLVNHGVEGVGRESAFKCDTGGKEGWERGREGIGVSDARLEVTHSSLSSLSSTSLTFDSLQKEENNVKGENYNYVRHGLTGRESEREA